MLEENERVEYQVGDEVLIAPMTEQEEHDFREYNDYPPGYEGVGFCSGMIKYTGTVVRIKRCYGGNEYGIEEDGGQYTWPADVFLPVESKYDFDDMPDIEFLF